MIGIRVDKPSALGPWSYEVVETKLARSMKATALIQVCFYSELLSQIQALVPERMHVVLGGTASPEQFQVQRYIAYLRKANSEFNRAWTVGADEFTGSGFSLVTGVRYYHSGVLIEVGK